MRDMSPHVDLDPDDTERRECARLRNPGLITFCEARFGDLQIQIDDSYVLSSVSIGSSGSVSGLSDCGPAGRFAGWRTRQGWATGAGSYEVTPSEVNGMVPGTADGSFEGQHLRCGSRIAGQAVPGSWRRLTSIPGGRCEVCSPPTVRQFRWCFCR